MFSQNVNPVVVMHFTTLAARSGRKRFANVWKRYADTVNVADILTEFLRLRSVVHLFIEYIFSHAFIFQYPCENDRASHRY